MPGGLSCLFTLCDPFSSLNMDPKKRRLKSAINELKMLHILVWFVILLPSVIKAGTSRFPMLLVQLTAMALLSFSILHCIRLKGCSFSYHALDLLMILFPILAAFSTFSVHYKHHAQSVLLLVLSFSIIYFCLAEFFSVHDLERLWWGFIGLGIFESMVGLYQFVFQNEYRVPGTFYNPNHLAGFLACLLMVLLARLALNPSFRRHIPFKILTIILFGAVILLTRSRGALLALTGGFFGLLCFTPSKKRIFSFLIAPPSIPQYYFRREPRKV